MVLTPMATAASRVLPLPATLRRTPAKRAKQRVVVCRNQVVSESSGVTAEICALVPSKQSVSNYNSARWVEVLELMQTRMRWENEGFQLRIFDGDHLRSSSEARDAFVATCGRSDMFVAVDMHTADDKALLDIALASTRSAVSMVMDSDQSFEQLTRINGLRVAALPPWALGLLAKLPGGWGRAAKQWPILKDMWRRRSSDDLAFMLFLAINDFVTPVPSTQVKMGGDLSTLACMCQNCLPEIRACLADPECKSALDALAACNLNDQVCSYRVIASYESRLLEQFSLCILQKHNCLGNHADIPMVPDPAPMASFRGQPVTHTLAEDILIGHLTQSPGSFSWRVVCGKNAAYDQFPCQYQIYYRQKGSVWYDPVFKVKTLDGREVWRRRHYRVRRGEQPGTFHYSVLDNGVTSKEFWRIMACAEDMSWAVFYYSGAASAAGIAYRGALLCTPSGLWPTSAEVKAEIEDALNACGIRGWEMFDVDNCDCGSAPLSLPPDARTTSAIMNV